MKSMNRFMAAGALVGALVLVAGVVKAGGTYYAPVSYSGTATAGTASGTLTTARNSSDSNQWILCSVTGSTTGNSVQCTAQDAAGTFRSCVSSAASLVQTALGMTSYGHLSFTWSSGACTQIKVTNGSRFLP